MSINNLPNSPVCFLQTITNESRNTIQEFACIVLSGIIKSESITKTFTLNNPFNKQVAELIFNLLNERIWIGSNIDLVVDVLQREFNRINYQFPTCLTQPTDVNKMLIPVYPNIFTNNKELNIELLSKELNYNVPLKYLYSCQGTCEIIIETLQRIWFRTWLIQTVSQQQQYANINIDENQKQYNNNNNVNNVNNTNEIKEQQNNNENIIKYNDNNLLNDNNNNINNDINVDVDDVDDEDDDVVNININNENTQELNGGNNNNNNNTNNNNNNTNNLNEPDWGNNDDIIQSSQQHIEQDTSQQQSQQILTKEDTPELDDYKQNQMINDTNINKNNHISNPHAQVNSRNNNMEQTQQQSQQPPSLNSRKSWAQKFSSKNINGSPKKVKVNVTGIISNTQSSKKKGGLNKSLWKITSRKEIKEYIEDTITNNNGKCIWVAYDGHKTPLDPRGIIPTKWDDSRPNKESFYAIPFRSRYNSEVKFYVSKVKEIRDRIWENKNIKKRYDNNFNKNRSKNFNNNRAPN